MMYLGLSAMLERDVINNETVTRYLTGHPVSKATLILFFIGAGSLLLIGFNVFCQYCSANDICLDKPLVESQNESNNEVATAGNRWERDQIADVDLAVDMGHEMLKLPTAYREHYLWRRLHEALHFVHRTGSSYGLEDETKYLSEMDVERQQQRYSLVRIMIWATPMLGFLGTVLGISQALGGINVGPENDFSQMMNGLRGSLYVAFDTTALALVLSMILMFAQFVVDRFETQLLSLVDNRTRQELAVHFDMALVGHEAIERMGVSVLETTDKLVERQSDLWRQSITAAEQAWSDSVTNVNDTLQKNLKDALDETLGNLAKSIDKTVEKADSSMAHRWQQWQITLSENARAVKEQQNEITVQTRLIKEVAEAVSTVGAVEPVHPDLPESDSEEIVFSTFDESNPVDRVLAPEVLIPPPSQKPVLKIFAPGDPRLKDADQADSSSLEVVQSGAESSPTTEAVPRYRSAEQEAGTAPIVVFPVQVESKNAA